MILILSCIHVKVNRAHPQRHVILKYLQRELNNIKGTDRINKKKKKIFEKSSYFISMELFLFKLKRTPYVQIMSHWNDISAAGKWRQIHCTIHCTLLPVQRSNFSRNFYKGLTWNSTSKYPYRVSGMKRKLLIALYNYILRWVAGGIVCYTL